MKSEEFLFRDRIVRSYLCRVRLEEDEKGWFACIPELEARGAATQSDTREAALRRIQEVAEMVIEGMLKDGESMPPEIESFDHPIVAVNLFH